MELKDKTLLEKEVLDENKSQRKPGFEKESVSKLFLKLDMDFNYKPFEQSSPSCKGSAYSFMLREKPLYASGADIAVNRLMNPLGSIYDRLNNGGSCGLPCDLGLLRR